MARSLPRPTKFAEFSRLVGQPTLRLQGVNQRSGGVRDHRFA
jgi:hypothetical protein